MNYAVLCNAIEYYWIGTTCLPLREGSIFFTYEESVEGDWLEKWIV